MAQEDVIKFLSKNKRRWYAISEMRKYLKNKSLASNVRKLYDWKMIRRKTGFPPNILVQVEKTKMRDLAYNYRITRKFKGPFKKGFPCFFCHLDKNCSLYDFEREDKETGEISTGNEFICDDCATLIAI